MNSSAFFQPLTQYPNCISITIEPQLVFPPPNHSCHFGGYSQTFSLWNLSSINPLFQNLCSAPCPGLPADPRNQLVVPAVSVGTQPEDQPLQAAPAPEDEMVVEDRHEKSVQTQIESIPALSHRQPTAAEIRFRRQHLDRRLEELEQERLSCPPGPELELFKETPVEMMTSDRLERQNQLNDVLHVLKVKRFWEKSSILSPNVFKQRCLKRTKAQKGFEVELLDLSRQRTYEKKGLTHRKGSDKLE